MTVLGHPGLRALGLSRWDEGRGCGAKHAVSPLSGEAPGTWPWGDAAARPMQTLWASCLIAPCAQVATEPRTLAALLAPSPRVPPVQKFPKAQCSVTIIWLTPPSPTHAVL